MSGEDRAWSPLFERRSIRHADVTFDFVADRELMHAHGVTAHSSTPREGRNAITHLAALLGTHEWPPTAAARMVRLINDLVGRGNDGERFGNLSVCPRLHGAVDALADDTRTLCRRWCDGRHQPPPSGWAVSRRDGMHHRRSARRVEDPRWCLRARLHVHRRRPLPCGVRVSHSGLAADLPSLHRATDGGGTQARLLPNGVNFGPSMPGAVYTGHRDHEFVTVDQLQMNLRMCAAMVTELAVAECG